ncbi:hypothetical protein [Treponema endosymbiont of Eucomonympha sp.]|uniref:hypothetical protein n=1 Tax=Treponema endosymbiont of Eucomonympha sp. TaxID=1580831 RepID=UPI000783D481|nr:hypothetical protein [Treponema endosymbiont of Eucomonympha sp.]
MFETEQSYFESHKTEFREKYIGKRIVICGSEFKGAYDTDGEAYEAAAKTMKPGTFMIKPVLKTDDEYIQRYMTRVYV